MSVPYDTIERLIDKYSVADVLIMIGNICNKKAAHIQSNWLDEGLAIKWNKAGRVVKRSVKDLPKVPGIQ
jgi:hypothetical protein